MIAVAPELSGDEANRMLASPPHWGHLRTLTLLPF